MVGHGDSQTLCGKSDILGPWTLGTAPPPMAEGSEGQRDCWIAQSRRLEKSLGCTCSVACEGEGGSGVIDFTKQVEFTPTASGPLHGDSAQFLS